MNRCVLLSQNTEKPLWSTDHLSIKSTPSCPFQPDPVNLNILTAQLMANYFCHVAHFWKSGCNHVTVSLLKEFNHIISKVRRRLKLRRGVFLVYDPLIIK